MFRLPCVRWRSCACGFLGKDKASRQVGWEVRGGRGGGGVVTLTGQECLQRCAVLVPSQDTQQIVSLVLVFAFFVFAKPLTYSPPPHPPSFFFCAAHSTNCCLFAPIEGMFVLIIISRLLPPLLGLVMAGSSSLCSDL